MLGCNCVAESLRSYRFAEREESSCDAQSVAKVGNFGIGIEDFVWDRCKRPSLREGFGIAAAFGTSNF